MRRLWLFSLVVPLLLVGTSAAQARRAGTTLDLVAYSTPKPVMEKIIYRWTHSPGGRGVSFTQSYGPSGPQARAIVAGQPADVALLATGLDVNTLVDAGLVAKGWKTAPFAGIGADSVVSFIVRKGNPKHIHGWTDLVRKGVQVITPNPFSSGSAKWNILAAYGAMRKTGHTNKQAVAFVTKLFRHVVSQDSSAANAVNTFLSGKGDVVISYESEAYVAQAAGRHDIGLVIPQQTMLIELPMVPLKSAPPQAKRFIAYAHSRTAQAIFAQHGFRPVVSSVLKSPALKKWKKRYALGSRTVFTISDRLFGGWRQADRVWFDPNRGRMVAIEREIGGPTG